MRFMCMILSENSDPPTPELMEAVNKLAEEEARAGRMIGGGGLLPVAMGAQVRLEQGELRLIDGPFVEAREVVGGYAIFEFNSKEEAIASAMTFMGLHKTHMPGWEGTCEIRIMMDEGAEGSCGGGQHADAAAVA